MCDLTIYDYVDEAVEYFIDSIDETQAEASQEAQKAEHIYAADEHLRKYFKYALDALADRCYDLGEIDAGKPDLEQALKAAAEYIVTLRQIIYSVDLDVRKKAYASAGKKGRAWTRWLRKLEMDK